MGSFNVTVKAVVAKRRAEMIILRNMMTVWECKVAAAEDLEGESLGGRSETA